jgi:hypothetical protein
MRLDDRLTGGLIALLGIVVAVAARGIPSVPGTTFGPDLLPTIVGVALAVCGGLIFLGGLRAAAPGPWVDLSDWAGRPRGIIGAVWAIGGTIAGVLYLQTIGFPLFAFGFALPLMLLMGAKPLMSVIVSAVVALVAFAIFYYLLLVPLPVGPLTFLG